MMDNMLIQDIEARVDYITQKSIGYLTNLQKEDNRRFITFSIPEWDTL